MNQKVEKSKLHHLISSSGTSKLVGLDIQYLLFGISFKEYVCGFKYNTFKLTAYLQDDGTCKQEIEHYTYSQVPCIAHYTFTNIENPVTVEVRVQLVNDSDWWMQLPNEEWVLESQVPCFQSRRVFSKGIEEVIDFGIEEAIWSMIAHLCEQSEIGTEEPLHIFKLCPIPVQRSGGNLLIIHRDNSQPNVETHLMQAKNPVACTLWAIDEETYWSMVDEEY